MTATTPGNANCGYITPGHPEAAGEVAEMLAWPRVGAVVTCQGREDPKDRVAHAIVEGPSVLNNSVCAYLERAIFRHSPNDGSSAKWFYRPQDPSRAFLAYSLVKYAELGTPCPPPYDDAYVTIEGVTPGVFLSILDWWVAARGRLIDSGVHPPKASINFVTQELEDEFARDVRLHAKAIKVTAIGPDPAQKLQMAPATGIRMTIGTPYRGANWWDVYIDLIEGEWRLIALVPR